MGGRLSAIVLFSACVVVGAASATETTTFTYDELGRLVSSANSGGPRSGKTNATQYDPAGNRSAVAVGQPLPPPNNAAVFSISGPVTLNEGETGVYTITKGGTAQSSLTVNFSTANGTAIAPGDYTANSGTLTFRAWESVRTIPVTTINDGIAEAAEQFSVTLSSPSPGASIGTGSAATTINGSGPANQPPVTATDAMPPVGVCLTGQKNVTANDTDPEGNYPLSLVSVGSSALGDVYVLSSTDVGFSAYGAPGSGSVTYTLQDSLGATATGTLNLTVVNGQGCQ